MNNPLVSVCIPTYNGAKFIEKCLLSCLSQTYTEIEIIICDDCSEDLTPEIIKKLISENSRIKFIKNSTNLGLVGNWNVSLSYAKGDYIKLLFQDDWMEPDAIEQFVAAAKLNYGFVISKRNFILDSNASQKEEQYYKNEVNKLENYFHASESSHYFSVRDIAKLATDHIALNFIAEPSLIFFKRSLLKETGLYDNNLHQICDLEFNLRLAAFSGIYVVNQPLCSFSIHSDSTTNSNLSKKYFQLRFIEQAYFAFKVLKDPAFSSLQKYFSLIQKFKLNFYWRYRMYEANRYLDRNANRIEFLKDLEKYPLLKQSLLAEVIAIPLFYIVDLVKSRR